MKSFGELIYSSDKASGEAISKVETHTPKIDAPSEVKAGEPFEIRVYVGPHPNKVEHSIRWVEIYLYEEGKAFNPTHIATVSLGPTFADPDIRLKIRLNKSSVIYAIGYCNLHGLWEGRKEIKVIK